MMLLTEYIVNKGVHMILAKWSGGYFKIGTNFQPINYFYLIKCVEI